MIKNSENLATVHTDNLNNKRIEWIDIARGICMLCVMISHTGLCPVLYRMIFGPFFLSMFFFISGYLFNPNKNIKEYIKRKTKTLLVPFIVFGLINIFLRQILTFNEKVGLIEQLKDFILQIGNSAGLWFIACLYIASLVFYLLNYYIKNNKVYIEVITILAIIFAIYNKIIGIELPWHIQKLGWAIFFMGLGKIYKETLEIKLKKYENSINLLYGILLYIALLIFNWLFFKNTYTSINTYDASIVMQFLLSIVSIWDLSLIVKLFIKSKFIKFIGQNTLIYFAFHGKVQSLLMKVLNYFITINSGEFFYNKYYYNIC